MRQLGAGSSSLRVARECRHAARPSLYRGQGGSHQLEAGRRNAGCRPLIRGWPEQLCVWQGLRDRWGRPGKLMVLSFGKEVIGKLASHSSRNLCLPNTHKCL